MRPTRGTDAHKTQDLAELVRSNRVPARRCRSQCRVGCCIAELRAAGSLIRRPPIYQVPAGGALQSVDRDGFAAAVTKMLRCDHPLITIERGEVDGPPEDWDSVIV
ncbi:MAG: hypothetical protein HPM95_16705 [Alphaproteobacteria bacterium]|nr:hypothetical protein [Alphaproteobacteria bacterium]